MYILRKRDLVTKRLPPFSLLFAYGVILGSSYYVMNSRGQEFVIAVFNNLSSPQLFFLFLAMSGFTFVLAAIVTGPRTKEPEGIVYWLGYFPAFAALDIGAGLLGFTSGLVLPLSLRDPNLLVALPFLYLAVVMAMVMVGAFVWFTFRSSYEGALCTRRYRALWAVSGMGLFAFVWWEFFRTI